VNPNSCSACGGTTFVRARMMERSGEYDWLYPLAITFKRKRKFKSLFSEEQVDTKLPDMSEPMGELDTLFCRGCGRVEWFVKNPADVPIGSEYGTELVEAAPAVPYR
jgi:hypothetical protein